MYTASRMQNIVHIRKKNYYFGTVIFLINILLLLGLSASRAPCGGAVVIDIDVFDPFNADGKLARPRSLQPQQYFSAR